MPSPEQQRRLDLNQKNYSSSDGCNINMVCVFCGCNVPSDEDGADPSFWDSESKVNYCYLEKDGRKQCVCPDCSSRYLIDHRNEPKCKPGVDVPPSALRVRKEWCGEDLQELKERFSIVPFDSVSFEEVSNGIELLGVRNRTDILEAETVRFPLSHEQIEQMRRQRA